MRPLVYLYRYVFPATGDSLRRAELVGSQFQRWDPGPAGRCRLVSGVTGWDLDPRGSPWALALGPRGPSLSSHTFLLQLLTCAGPGLGVPACGGTRGWKQGALGRV